MAWWGIRPRRAERVRAEPAFGPEFRRLLLEVVRRTPRSREQTDRTGPARKQARSRSGTFAGHRRYGQGDDVRDIDWHAYARTRELYAKVLQDEERRTLTLFVDSSLSQDAGSPPRRIATLRYAAIEGARALARLDALHLVHGNGRAQTLRGAAALDTLLTSLEQAMPAHVPLQMARQPLDAGWAGRCVWISDFVPPDAVAPALALLRRHGRRCVGLLPELPEDRVPDLQGVLALRDPETGERHIVRVDGAVQRSMADELAALRRAQDAVFRAAGFVLVRVRVPSVTDVSLAAWSRPWAAPPARTSAAP